MMNISGKKNFMQQMGRLSMHSLTILFFFNDREGEVGIFLFVPIKFPNMFPKMLPITPYGLPIVQLPCI
jgi:hypothetical protein